MHSGSARLTGSKSAIRAARQPKMSKYPTENMKFLKKNGEHRIIASNGNVRSEKPNVLRNTKRYVTKVESHIATPSTKTSTNPTLGRKNDRSSPIMARLITPKS